MFRRSFLKGIGLFFASLFGLSKSEPVQEKTLVTDHIDLGCGLIFDERKCCQCQTLFLTRSGYNITDKLFENKDLQGEKAEGTTSYCFCSKACEDLFNSLKQSQSEFRNIYRMTAKPAEDGRLYAYWDKVRMFELHDGDIFELDGDICVQWTAVGEPYLNKEGVWTIEASSQNLLQLEAKEQV
jgi:hypothetical protein